MDSVNSAPAHVMMRHTDVANGHSTKPRGRATTSAFASYGFGPVEEAGGKDAAGVRPVTGATFGPTAAGAGNMSWIAQAQSLADAAQSRKG